MPRQGNPSWVYSHSGKLPQSRAKGQKEAKPQPPPTCLGTHHRVLYFLALGSALSPPTAGNLGLTSLGFPDPVAASPYLGNFGFILLFGGLKRLIVVPGTVIVHQLPPPLSNA